MLRSVLAVVFGFVSMSVLVMAGTFALIAVLVPGGIAGMRVRQNSGGQLPTPTMRYYVANILLSFAAAVFGAWVTARVAVGPVPDHKLADPTATLRNHLSNHLIGLGAVIALMGVVSAFSPGSGRQPMWYKLTIPLVGIAGVATYAFLLLGSA